MREVLRRLELVVAWHLLEALHWGEHLLWDRYDQDFVATFILPDLDREVEPPPDAVEAMNPDIIDDIPF